METCLYQKFLHLQDCKRNKCPVVRNNRGHIMRKLVSRYQWPRSLGAGSTAPRLMGLRVPIPPAAWMCLL